MRRRNEYRVMPYRPVREAREPPGALGLILRFTRRYVWPHRGQVGLCILLVSLNACSVYLQSYYGRVVVDEILMIGTPPAAAAAGSDLPVDRDRATPASARASDGSASERARLSHDTRPPWAGRRLGVLFIIYLVTILVLNAADRTTQRVQSRVAQQITARLREDMHAKIVGLSMSYHLANTPGRLMSRILADVGVVQSQLMQLIVTASSQLIMFAVGLTIVWVLDWRVAVVVLAAMAPYTFVVSRVRKTMREVNRELRHTNACLWGLVSQKLDAVRAIVAYSRERAEQLNFHRLSACLLRDTVRQQHLGAGMNRTAELVTSLTTRGILVYGAVCVLAGTMTLGQMMYINGAAASLFMPVITLTQMALHVSALLVVLQRLTQIFETKQEVTEDPHAVDFPSPVRTGLSVRDVTFNWSSDRPPVLEDITLDIPVGRWICVMGPSGCGKTTLLQLLARLFDPQEGSVSVDGVELGDIRFASLRRHMALVPQEPQILSGTIRDNITYGHPHASPSEIMAAAKAAECHDFIMDLPAKYETLIGEKGTTLSGGQKQRVSIARALITNPEVLLLDDCTSALDANTERRLQETLSRLLQGKTAVIVSQRVSMALRCQRVVVLQAGRITKQGPPARLLEQGGYFAQLHAKQIG